MPPPSSRSLLGLLHAGPLGKLVELWDAIQVELHGRYSLARFHDLQHHAQSSSRLLDLATVVLSPLPCLFVVTAMDMLPVRSPRLGFLKQTVWIVFRVAFAGWIMTFMIIMQVHHSSPTLPLSTARLWAISLVGGATCAVVYSLLGIFVAFPTPFATQMLTPPWFTTLTSGLYLSWRHALRRDAVARENLRCYLVVFVAQVTIILVYTAYNIAFTTVGRAYQTYVALLLPILKLVFKNVMNRGIYHMEDLAPTVIVFNVDAFHALFVSSTMQQAKTGGSVVFIMVVDVVQAIIACMEIQTVMLRIRRRVAKCDSTDKAETQRLHSLGLLGFARHILDTYPRVREHPQLTFPRHLRAPTTRRLTLLANVQAQTVMPAGPTIDHLKMVSGPRVSSTGPDPTTSQQLPAVEQIRVHIVQDVLKLLHMVEFYVLIEFAEVVIAAVYTLYLLALSFLPIRAYYKPLASLSAAQMDTAVEQVAQYASLELLSFVVFCVVLDRVLAWRVSTISQLAFVLQKHARIMQTTLVMWVFFVAQLTFEHLGTDYSFKFQWLHEAKGAT